jgi:glycosyltransferase 2 family protein
MTEQRPSRVWGSSFFAKLEEDRKVRRRYALMLGYGLGLVYLYWVLHDFRPSQALQDVRNASWSWVVLGISFDILGYLAQAVRWKLLLQPFRKVPISDVIRAIFTGLFANIVLPLHPGELLRAYLLSKTEQLGFGTTIGSVGVERLIDLIVATTGLGLASLFVPLPLELKRSADILGVVALILLGILVGAVLYFELTLRHEAAAHTASKHVPGKVRAALVGLHAMGTAPSFYPAVLVSIAMQGLQVLAIWSMMRSYGMGLPFLASVVVLLVINIGVSLPNAPANVGSYQFFCVLALSVFGVEKSTATGFSIFAFMALTIPFLFLGFWALLRSGLTLHDLREQIRGLPSENRNGAPAA